MGKNIFQQRRGRGTIRFRTRKQAFTHRITYPNLTGKGIVIKLINSVVHTAPLALIRINDEEFYNPAATGMYEGQEIEMGPTASITPGNILPLDNIPPGSEIYNIEITPFAGGRLVRASGTSAKVVKKTDKGVLIALPSKEEKLLSIKSRATIGSIAGVGRTEKPIVKAGKMWHMKKARGKPYHKTSPIKMNAVSHPFGSGRGKHLGKSRVPPRFAPAGRKVGLLRASRTGRRKR